LLSSGEYAEALKTALDDSPTRARDETCKVSVEIAKEKGLHQYLAQVNSW
jgi:hypothetical protein